MADFGRRNLTNSDQWQRSDSEHTDSASSSDEREPLHNSNQTYMTEAPYTPNHQGSSHLHIICIASVGVPNHCDGCG